MAYSGVKFSSLVDRSGSIAVANKSQVLLAVNATRRGWRIMNTSTEEMWFNDTGGDASPGGLGCFRVDGGDYYESPPGSAPGFRVSLYGVAAGQTFSASEW